MTLKCGLEANALVRSHSRSLKVVAFESLGVVSYLPSIVTVAVSVAVVRYLASKWCDLENRVTVRRSIQHMRLSIGLPL